MENILVKILSITCTVLALSTTILFFVYKDSRKENAMLVSENKGLLVEIKRRDNDILEVSKRKKELEAAIKNDKSNFDWSYHIRDSDPVKRLQKQCLSCSTRAN